MTVRILRASPAGSGVPAPRGRAFAATVHTLDSARWEARLEAERTLAEARREAEALVATAHGEADAIRERATIAGREAAHAEVAALLARAQADSRKTAERATALVVTATKAVAERALGKTLAESDENLTGWAREALATIADAKRIVVRAAPGVAARLRGKDLGRSIEIVDDPAIEGNVLLARSELGGLTVDVRTQLDAFVAAIADVLQHEVSRV